MQGQLITVYEPHTGRLFPCIETDDPEHLRTHPTLPIAGPFSDVDLARRYARQVLGTRDVRVAHNA